MTPSNPWKRLRSRTVYANPWLTVREDEVIRPDGEPGIYGVIETRVATGVVALTAADEVVLVGQYRYPLNAYSWEIVEGGGEIGSNPLETAKRELVEEAGLVARVWHPLGGVIHLSNCISSEEGYLFLATELEEVPADPDPTEILQLRRVAFGEALNMVNNGEITDAMSIIGILRAAQLRGR